MKKETEKAVMEIIRFLRDNDRSIYYEQLVEYLKYNKIDEYQHPRGMGRALSALYNRFNERIDGLPNGEEYDRFREELEADRDAILCIKGKNGKEPWADE